MSTHTFSPRLRFVFAGLFLAASVAGYAGVLTVIRAHQAATIATREELALETAREQRSKDTAAFLADVREDQERLSSYFITGESAVGVIEDIERLGRGAGTAVDIAQVGFAHANAPDDTFIVGVEARGPWQGAAHLLRMLEVFPRHSMITAASLAAERESATTTTWLLSATLRFGVAGDSQEPRQP